MPRRSSRSGRRASRAADIRRRFGLVIFDNDGVLVDSEPLANGILADLLGEHGLPLTVTACMDEFMGSSLGRVRAIAESRLGSALPADFEARYESRLFAGFSRSLQPVEGVKDVLAALADAGVGVFVASSGSRQRIRLALAATGLDEWCGARVVSAEDVVRGKPAPDLFLRAAERAGVTPDDCAVIEDSPLGVEAAGAAGMTAFGFAGRTPTARLAGARGGVVSRMSELPGLLGV